MAAKLRLLSAVCALVAAVIVVWQTNPVAGPDNGSVQLRSTSAPMSDVSTTIKWPVIETVNPNPFDACKDIPQVRLSKGIHERPQAGRMELAHHRHGLLDQLGGRCSSQEA